MKEIKDQAIKYCKHHKNNNNNTRLVACKVLINKKLRANLFIHTVKKSTQILLFILGENVSAILLEIKEN